MYKRQVYTTDYRSQCDRERENAIAVAGMGHDWDTSAGLYSNSRDAIGADAKGSATLTKAAVGFQPDGQWITTKWAFDLNSEKVSYTFGENSGDVYITVSYTHLDVYKRQIYNASLNSLGETPVYLIKFLRK